MTQHNKIASRRSMLFGAAAATAATAAIVALPKAQVIEEAAATVPKEAPEKGGGYHVTAHIKHYYSTALI